MLSLGAVLQHPGLGERVLTGAPGSLCRGEICFHHPDWTVEVENAPIWIEDTFQWLMERVLKEMHWKSLLLHLDDIIVITPEFHTHLQCLEEVIRRLQ